MNSIKKHSYTRIILSGLLVLLLFLNFSTTIDSKAAEPLSESFNRALVTFGVVRSINGIISVVQGTEVAIEPAGVGVILTPGQIFDPINDLIERFSWIVLMASTSLGAQRILIEIGTTLISQLLVLCSIGVLTLTLWKPQFLPSKFRPATFRIAITVLLLRFLVPVVVLANEVIYDAFLSDQYNNSYASLEQVDREVQALQSEEDTNVPTEEGSFFDSIGRWYDRTAQRIDVSSRFSEYESRLENTSENIVNLIVVFILQTLVFPLLFLWLAIKFGRIIVKGKFWNPADT